MNLLLNLESFPFILMELNWINLLQTKPCILFKYRQISAKFFTLLSNKTMLNCWYFYIRLQFLCSILPPFFSSFPLSLTCGCQYKSPFWALPQHFLVKIWFSLKFAYNYSLEHWNLELECVNSYEDSNIKSLLNSSSPTLCGLTKAHSIQSYFWASPGGWGWSGLPGLCCLVGTSGAGKSHMGRFLILCLENWSMYLFGKQSRERGAR